MKIKQQRPNGAAGSPPGERDLEDLLLKSQRGLVLLRELHNRRDQQWKAVFEHYGYENSLPNASSTTKEDPPQQVAKQPQWLQTLTSKLLFLNQQVAATSYCAVKRSQLMVDQNRTPASRMLPTRSPVLVKQHVHALETHHRLKHALESAEIMPTSPRFVNVDDVNHLMQFNYLKHQQAIVLERFCTRLNWLPVSHSFHVRQRTLALTHHLKVKNAPRLNSAAAYHNSKECTHCPLFLMSTSLFMAELKMLAQKYSIPAFEGIGTCDKIASAEKYEILRQGVDVFLASAVSAFPPDNAINLDGHLEISLESVVHAHTRNTRWELIQRGYLRNCEPSQGGISETLITLRNDHKIDSLLANEWELLSLADVGYLRVRLEALSRAHMARAKVDVAKSDLAAVNGITFEKKFQSERTEQRAESCGPHGDNKNLPKFDMPHSWNPDALYSLYALRISSCRTKRLSLLRLLNYLHFVQLCQTGTLHHSECKNGKCGLGPKSSQSVTPMPSRFGAEHVKCTTASPFVLTKCDKTGDYVIMRALSCGEVVVDAKDASNGGLQEFIFAAARRDLEALELQMLRLASIFIFKQEYDSLPTSQRKHNNDKNGDNQNSDSIVTTIDRLHVLHDIYDCEVGFQQTKVRLVNKLLECGLEYAPRNADINKLGLDPPDGHTDPFTAILLPLLQRRPLIDFSHAYFSESYAAETLLLELQGSLVQQMNQHFQRLEWCDHQEFAVGEESAEDNENRQWVCRKILGSEALTRLYAQQEELIREADEKWFTATSIGDFQALQTVLLEEAFVIWSLIIKLELPGRPVHCLERTAKDLLSGSGWLFVFPPQLLSDVCRTLHEQTKPRRTLVECYAKAIELDIWRQNLAKNVYEAHLLERVHNFQIGFVKQIAAFDTVVGGELAHHPAFFFDFGECDRISTLQPIALELEMPMFHTNGGALASRPTALLSGENKSLSEWLQAQLSALHSRTGDGSENDEIDTEAKHSETWRRSILSLQQQYVSYMMVTVNYQDAVGADVFEFAASYPYVCLANSLAPESSSSSNENSNLAMDINTVRTKYAKEISDKMSEEMRMSCFPYWKRLEILKQQLQERFTTAPNQTSDGLKAVFASLKPGCNLEVDMAACNKFLSDEMHHPQLLITLNDHLQRLRNEKRLMQQLSPAARAKCAFITRSEATDKLVNESQNDEDQSSGLTKWLLVKLHQLKEDLQIHERPKVEQLLLTPPASYASPTAAVQRGKMTFGTDRSVDESSLDVQTLLQTIPSFRCLLHTFAVSYERSRPDSTGVAASAHATRLHEHREETLRVLLSIFDQLSCALDLLRIRCGSHFATTRYTSSGSGLRCVTVETSSESTPGNVYAGLHRLERWQTLYHYEVRHLLDNITSRLSPEAAISTGDLFDTHPEHLKSQYYASLMRQEMYTALNEATAHSIRILRCTTNFALLQTYQKNAGVRVRKRRQNLLVFQSTLEAVDVEVASMTNLSRDQTATTTHRNRSEGKRSLTAKVGDLVRVGENAFFGEARPREREREWHSFKDAIGKYEPRDSAYIAAITHLLQLHRVLIDENCQSFLQLEGKSTIHPLTSQCTAENQALTVLEDLWERFQLPAWDTLLEDEFSLTSGRSVVVVGGKNLHMKKRLLGNTDLGIGVEPPSGTSLDISSLKDSSFALRSLYMGSTTALVQFCNTGMLVLPPPSTIEDQLSYLNISVELTWVNADIKELDDQYKKFLFYRKTHREYQPLSSATPEKPENSPQLENDSSCFTAVSLLLDLKKFYYEEGMPDDKVLRPDLQDNAEPPQRKPVKKDLSPVFVVPASEMARFLAGITANCVDHSQRLLDLQNTFMQQLRDQCQTTTLKCEMIEKQWATSKVEERIRREAFAVDHAYHLYFEVEALRKQIGVLEARRELDHQALRCDLNAEYGEKLRLMHAEILNKQQKFAEYRTTMQRELQSVIQGAHTQFVDHLLDYSGAIPSATKASVATLLRGQQDVVRIKSENAAMKQALLKVQALGDMQQQMQNAARDRELLLTQRYSTAEALQRQEVEKLQAYVKQLEGNLSMLSQEKTYFQVKWTTAQKQMEATAQKKREARVRALSSAYTRTMPTSGVAAVDSVDDDSPVVAITTRKDVDTGSDTDSVTDTCTTRPPIATGAVDNIRKQELQRIETKYLNTTRHYQNEIRRLQQQVTREIREKAAIAEQLTQLRQLESSASIQSRDGLPLLDGRQTPRTPREEDTLGRTDDLIQRRTQSASPRTPSRPLGCVAPPDRSLTPRRPKSSFSPRASLLHAQVVGGASPHPPVLVPSLNTTISAASTPSSRPSTANSTTGTPARKFQVVRRESNAVGGIAGVSNSLSIREPLPYR
ncbi:unnamed protein product [Phytophthora fragariaefolia]|uniref:Unnamed protein product n=1 Tax=Phytophthora fragariaefolia TaxID=1490495 RepID=A0A9W6XXU8_9STRA|nr:unnamed protein product [Phytophthora fragariaefolia]